MYTCNFADCHACSVIADPEFCEFIQHRFHREKQPGVLSDIYNGSAYMKYSDFFEEPYNLSFAFNFDGAPKFKSSSVQIWPVQLCVNELPPRILYVQVCMWYYSRRFSFCGLL